MSDFFNYTFDIVNPDATTQNGSGGFSPTAPASVPKARKPISYFFTDIDGINVQTSEQAFGPLGATDEEKSKRFRVTNTFTAKTGVEASAYAVTKGLLFFAPHGDDTDKINIFLKPITTESNIGIKIKYFVYRGVLIKKLFEKSSINAKQYILPKTDTLDFIQRLWKEYAEFNKLDITDSSVSFSAKEIGLDPTNPTDAKLLKQYFKKGPYNLPIIKEGERIGYFAPEFGFEIVIDDGDHEQDTSDTGLSLDYNTTKTTEEDIKDIDFARAKKCILDVRKYDDFPTTNLLDKDYVWGFNNKSVHEKIFRENIYHFIDPCAFYGSHVTINNDKNEGKVYISKGVYYNKPSDIYINIALKFFNNQKTYIYVKSKRSRSYNYYDNDLTPLEITSNINKTLKENEWPIRIISEIKNYLSLKFNLFSINPLLYINVGICSINKPFLSKKDLLIGWLTPNPTFNFIGFSLPGIYPDKKISSIIFLTYFYDKINENNLFGPVNLNSIFEKEDFADNVAQKSWVNHLRPILISEGENIGLYNTKIVLDGDLISSNQSLTGATDEILSKNLRTYILLPVEANAENLNGSEVPKDNTPLITAGYAVLPKEEEKETTDNDPVKKYCKDIYGGGDIWGGMINDSGEIKSLVYRRDNNEDTSIYQLGISQRELNILKDRVYATDANATNLFFHLEEDTTSTASNFIKYKLKIQFDKADGNLGTPPNVGTSDVENIDYISLYTIDGCFYFTKDYANNFKFYKEFADTTVEFRPHQDWDGEFGMDWYRKGQNTWQDITGNKIYDVGFAGNVGVLPNQTDGNSYVDPKGANFVSDSKMLSNLKRKEYDVYPTTWTLAIDNETECFVSWLSLDKGKTAKLNLRIRVKKEAGKLRIRYPNKYFKITTANYTDPLDVNFSFYDFPPDQKKVTTTARFFDLEITCIEEFNFIQNLEVKADDKLAGVLKAFPNANKPVQNILFVPVKIKMPDGSERNFSPPSTQSNPNTDPSPVATDYLTNQKKWLEQFLLQSQIKANVEMFNDNGNAQLDLTSDINFNKEFAPDDTPPYVNNKGMFNRNTGTVKDPIYSLRAYYANSDPLIKNRLNLKEYLKEHLTKKYKEAEYNNYLIVFFMNIVGHKMINDTTAALGTLNGFSFGLGTDLMVFKLDNENNETVSHEIYHSLGIPHTFDKTDQNSLYVYKGKQTDNLLDYTHHKMHTGNIPYDRRSLYHWQWIVARKNLKK